MSTVPAATAQVEYTDLYARWERGNWSATALDFTDDRVDWYERMTAEQREAALWLLTLFFHGEHAVTEELAAFVGAAREPEEEYFLATQQVDEARHAIFFGRFLREVAGIDGDGASETLSGTDPTLTWGHRKVFGRLQEVSAALVADPSPVRLASAVTLYHVIVEGGLAQPGQEVLADAFTSLGVLPAFREGLTRVATDEQRHIAFGVRLLAGLLDEHGEEVLEAITTTYREVIPWSNALALPPNRDPAFTQSLGFTLEDLFATSARSQEAKLRAVGVPAERIDRLLFPLDQTPRERARSALTLLDAGIIGPRDEPVRPDPRALEVMFDLMRRAARPGALPAGTAIRWDFTDAEPWELRWTDDGVQAAQGGSDRPALSLRISLEDWLDLGTGEANPVALLARRRLRVRGQRRLLLRLESLFD